MPPSRELLFGKESIQNQKMTDGDWGSTGAGKDQTALACGEIPFGGLCSRDYLGLS